MMRFLLGVAWAVFSVMFDAYAIWLVWGWHGVPLGFPALSLARAAGVSALMNLFVMRPSREDADALHTVMKTHDLRRKLRLNPTTTKAIQDEAEQLVAANDKAETDVMWVRRALWVYAVIVFVVVAKIAAMLAR